MLLHRRRLRGSVSDSGAVSDGVSDGDLCFSDFDSALESDFDSGCDSEYDSDDHYCCGGERDAECGGNASHKMRSSTEEQGNFAIDLADLAQSSVCSVASMTSLAESVADSLCSIASAYSVPESFCSCDSRLDAHDNNDRNANDGATGGASGDSGHVDRDDNANSSGGSSSDDDNDGRIQPGPDIASSCTQNGAMLAAATVCGAREVQGTVPAPDPRTGEFCGAGDVGAVSQAGVDDAFQGKADDNTDGAMLKVTNHFRKRA